MPARLITLLRRLREDRGVVSLELFVSVGVWFASVLIFVNMFVLLGTSMLVNTALTRAAQQTAALGCFSKAVEQDFVARQKGMGASNFQVVARTPATMSPSYAFNHADMEDDTGNLNGAASVTAECDAEGIGLNEQRDRSANVTNGEYIWLRVTYTQRVALFPGAGLDVTMKRSALVVSQSLRDDPPGA